MPIYLHQHILPIGELGIWKIEESESFFRERLDLAPPERAQLEKIKGRRRTEWLAARQLVHYMSGREERSVFIKDSFGKPHLKDSTYQISISHSRDMAAAIAAPLPVGIDIQVVVEKIDRIAHKFMRAEEMASLQAATRIEHLHVYWGAKEALYKAYGRRELDFCGHIFIDPFSFQPGQGTIMGHIRKGDFTADYQLQYQQIDHFILVYGMELEKNMSA
jgi:4'-phosphopantetheinyl transferase